MAVEPTQTATVSCPECGGDVRVLKQIKQSRSHRSRVIPSVLWLVLVLALVAIWFWTGAWTTTSRTGNLRNPVGSDFRTAYVPWEPTENAEPVYISSGEMHRAIEGDKDALRKVNGTLTTIIDRVDANQGVAGLMGVRFSFKEPQAQLDTYTAFGLGGGWFLSGNSRTLSDIRDVDSSNTDVFTDWESRSWGLYPRISYSQLKSDTTNGRILNLLIYLHYPTILGILSLCMIFAWFIRWVGRSVGVKSAEKRFVWSAIVVSFFAFCFIGAVLNQSTSSKRYTTSSQSTQISSMYSIEELRASTLDALKTAEWCASLLTLIPKEQNRDLLLGQLWVFDKSKPKSSHEYTSKSVEIAVIKEHSLIRWGEASYGDEVALEDLPKTDDWYPLHSLRDQGTVAIRWGSPRRPKYVFVNIVNIALVVVSLFWVWAGLHWASRRILGCVQRRRVRRDQCIFCAYPLTSEARIARNPLQAP